MSLLTDHSSTATVLDQPLALLGGPKAVPDVDPSLFAWPIVTGEDEAAVLEVLRRGAMSLNDVTRAFEDDYAAWTGAAHALAYPNGTESLKACLWAVGVGAGDEVICPSLTYWASCAQVLQLGGTVNFADVDPVSLCLAPGDIEHRIGPRTRAIVVVHYAGHPCDMDAILAIARRHGVAVVEDVSHAHGSIYKGRHCGTLGDIAGMSMMSGKGFPIGEGGMLLTNDRRLYERALAYGFYERTAASRWMKATVELSDPELRSFSGIPLGGCKHRLNQLASAMGRVQLRHYPARMQAIQAALNRFWDLLDGVPGLAAHRIDPAIGSMGGWYFPLGRYLAEQLDGLPLERFCAALAAEGVRCSAGANAPLHLHPYFHHADIFNHGRPTAIAFGQRDVRQGRGTLPVCERVIDTVFSIPWFKHDRPAEIARHALAVRKVIRHVDQLR